MPSGKKAKKGPLKKKLDEVFPKTLPFYQGQFVNIIWGIASFGQDPKLMSIHCMYTDRHPHKGYLEDSRSSYADGETGELFLALPAMVTAEQWYLISFINLISGSRKDMVLGSVAPFCHGNALVSPPASFYCTPTHFNPVPAFEMPKSLKT